MPIYEYQCAACGQVVERWQKISDAPLAECPACGGSLHKIISSCAFHLKGSGWYVTDYSGRNAASGPSDNGDGAKPRRPRGPRRPRRHAQDRGRAGCQDKMTHLLKLPVGREREQ
jgi:putative FmdB family regulatory protein